MQDVKTEWIPRETPPVHPGEYDVIIRRDLVTEEEARAAWSNRFGRYDFWKVQNWVNATHAEALNVIKWRGRELPRRVALLPEEPVRRRASLLP